LLLASWQLWLFSVPLVIVDVYFLKREDRLDVGEFGDSYKKTQGEAPRMNAIQRIMQKLRARADFMKHKHEECANFEDGRCKFYHIKVNPKASACPHFKAKKKEETKNANNTAEDN
jgi:hypothetical protein